MLKIQEKQLAVIVRPTGGGTAAPIELLRGVKTHALGLRFDGDVTIAGGGGGTVNAEGVQRCIERVKIIENGAVTVDMSGRQLGYYTNEAQHQAANIVQLSAATAANYLISGDFLIDFASIWGGDPGETCYMERNSQAPTQIEVTWAVDAQAALISGTGLTVNSMSISPTQVFDPLSKQLPVFLPRHKYVASKALVAGQDFDFYLNPDAGTRVSSILIQSLSDGVTVDTILNGTITVQDDAIRYYDRVNRFTQQNRSRQERNFPAPRLGYMHINFRKYGKLSEMYVTGQGDNFRFTADCATPGTSNQFIAGVKGMLPVPGFTAGPLPLGW